MVRYIPATEMQLFIHCQDDEGNHGVCFLRDTKTHKQFGDSYIDTVHLYNGHEARFCKSHGIKIILPQDKKRVKKRIIAIEEGWVEYLCNGTVVKIQGVKI